MPTKANKWSVTKCTMNHPIKKMIIQRNIVL